MFNVYSFSIWESSELWKKRVNWRDKWNLIVRENLITITCASFTWFNRWQAGTNLVPRAFPSKNGWAHFLRKKPWGRGWDWNLLATLATKIFFQSLQGKKMVWSVYKFFFSLGNTVLINKGKRNYYAQQQQSSVFTTCTGMYVWLAWFWFCVSIDSAIRSLTCLLYWFWWSDSP